MKVLDLLRVHKPILVERFDVTELALFGSFARDTADENSDIDVLVRFAGTATARPYFGVLFYIEDLTGRPVDLANTKFLRPELRPYIDREKIVI